MNKTLRNVLIFIVIFALLLSINLYCYATGSSIDMNLEGNNQNIQNDISNEQTNELNNNNEYTSSSSGSSESSATVSSLSALPESELGLTNILNIILICIGVLLILLSIAILIKLKNSSI